MKPIIHPADYYRKILAAQPHALKSLDASVAIVKLNRDQQVPEDAGPAGRWYYVIAGAVRYSTIRPDGRRQLLDLMLIGDFFLVGSSQRDDTIEAVTEETVLASYSGARLENLGERDHRFAREMRDITFQSLERSRQQLVVLGGVTAADKVSAFLLHLGYAMAISVETYGFRSPGMIWRSTSQCPWRPCVARFQICSSAGSLP